MKFLCVVNEEVVVFWKSLRRKTSSFVCSVVFTSPADFHQHGHEGSGLRNAKKDFCKCYFLAIMKFDVSYDRPVQKIIIVLFIITLKYEDNKATQQI